jgi:NADH:ubiquinone oxidoreductase subunit K
MLYVLHRFLPFAVSEGAVGVAILLIAPRTQRERETALAASVGIALVVLGAYGIINGAIMSV